MLKTKISDQVNTFLTEEPLGAARHFGRASEKIYGERASFAFFALYMYVRELDDAVDTSQEPDKVRNMLLGEIATLTYGCKIEDITTFNPGYVIVEDLGDYTSAPGCIPLTRGQFENIQCLRNLLQWGLMNLDGAIIPDVAHYLVEGLRGFYLENEYNDLGEPIPGILTGYRNHRALTVYFEIASLVLWGKKLGVEKTIQEFDEFIDWAVKADVLNDLIDDLTDGVIPIEDELLKEFNIRLQKGEKIPKDIIKVWNSLRSEVLRNAPKSLIKSLAPDFPIYTKVLFSIYFTGKLMKLILAKPPIVNGQIYGGASNH